MKQVIDTYGKFILECMILVLLLILLFTQIRDDEGNQGVIQIIGARIETTDMDYDSYADFDVYVSEGALEKPVITYTGGNTIRIGMCRLSDYMKAVDYNGNELSVYVMSVLSPAGAELVCNADTEINFPLAGVYRVQVKAVDGMNKKTVKQIKIPVSE